MTNEVDIEALEQMLTADDRIEIAGYCESAIQIHPSEEAMQEARDFVGSPVGLAEIASVRFSGDEKAAMAARTRERFSRSIPAERAQALCDAKITAEAASFVELCRRVDAEEKLAIQISARMDAERLVNRAVANRRFALRMYRRLQIRSIAFTCAGLVVGIAIGWWVR